MRAGPAQWAVGSQFFKSIILYAHMFHLFIGWFFFMNDVPFVTWMNCWFNKINEQQGEHKGCRKQTFHLLEEMAHPKEGSTQVSHSHCYSVLCCKFY